MFNPNKILICVPHVYDNSEFRELLLEKLPDANLYFVPINIDEVSDFLNLQSTIVVLKPNILVLDSTYLLSLSNSSFELIKRNYASIFINLYLENSLLEEGFNFRTYGLKKGDLFVIDFEYIINLIAEEKIKQLMNSINEVDIEKEERLKSMDNITRMEKTVLRCLSAEMSLKEISTQLNISIETTKTHVKNIYRKLNVHNSVSAVLLAYEYNLFE